MGLGFRTDQGKTCGAPGTLAYAPIGFGLSLVVSTWIGIGVALFSLMLFLVRFSYNFV